MDDSLIGLRVWLAGNPWRPRPAWAVVAGALAAGAVPWRQQDAVALLLLVFLADALWGSVWGLLGGRAAFFAGGVNGGFASPLPYTQPGSPAARWFAWLQGPEGRAWRDGAVALAWALFLAGLVSAKALALTGTVGILAILSRDRATGQPLGRLAAGLVALGLPWALGVHLFGAWGWRNLLPAASFTLLAASIHGSVFRFGVGVAHIAIIAFLVWERLPLAAGGVGLLLWPPMLWVVQGVESPLLLRRAGPWWLAALLASAWATRSF